METYKMNQDKVEQYFRLLMSEGLGLDMSDPNLCGTAGRVAKMYCQEFFKNVDEEFPAEKLTTFPNEDGYDEIILADNIPFVSICSHHFLPFTGKAWFLYIPNHQVIEDKEALLSGASKMARVVQHYASRPQLQERLAKQIVKRFEELVKPNGIMLVMRAVHGCMSCRGVKSGNNSGLVTSIVRGAFKEHASTRSEAMDLIKLSLMDR